MEIRVEGSQIQKSLGLIGSEAYLIPFGHRNYNITFRSLGLLEMMIPPASVNIQRIFHKIQRKKLTILPFRAIEQSFKQI